MTPLITLAILACYNGMDEERIKPPHPDDTRLYLADAALAEGHADLALLRARALLDRLGSNNPPTPARQKRARKIAGLAAYQLRRWVDAVGYLQSVVQDEPKDATLKARLGEATVRARLFPLGAEPRAWLAAYELSDSPSTIAALASLLEERGDAKAALALKQRS